MSKRQRKRTQGHPAPRQRPTARRAPQKRAAHADFVASFSLRALSLPLPLLPSVEPPPQPPRRFCSCYRPPSPRRSQRFFAWFLAHPRRQPSLFEIALYLLDWSGLRPLLPWPRSNRGEAPFDPLSLLLVCLWKISSNQHWNAVASLLAHPQQGAYWRMLFGFTPRKTPGEATLRAFRDRLPDDFLNQVQRFFLWTLHRAGLLPPWAPHGYVLSGDGQLHDARSLHRCHHAIPSCYTPIAAGDPRPCPALLETKGQYGCTCADAACQQRCALAPRLDPQAGFIVYTHRQRRENGQVQEVVERAVFGYRSIADRLLDLRFHHAWNVHTLVVPAHTDEGTAFSQHFPAACRNLPESKIAYALYDSACGEQPCLDLVYDCGGIPLFDVKADPSDDDPAGCLQRGYDAHGHPFCPYGYLLTFQGLDWRKQPRARWVCGHACRRSPPGEVAGCPWLEKRRGFHFYLTRHFRDGSYRLARLVPHGTPLWKKHVAWRDLSESRNGTMKRLGLERLPDYGLRHAAFLIIAADLVENLNTLARLVCEATLLDPHFRPQQEQAPCPIPVSSLPAPAGDRARPAQEGQTLG